MKSRIFLFAAALLATSFVVAQNANDEVVTEFNPHWYLQVQGGAAETLGEVSFTELISPAAQLAIGRQFSPNWAVRFAVDGWQAKGSWVNPHNVYKFNYVGANFDVFFNLTNAICGWKPDRVFNFSLFAGAGCNYAFNNQEAVDFHATSTYTPAYLWRHYWITPVGRFGCAADVRLTERLALGLEANANILNDHFNSKKAHDSNVDWQFNALLGLKLALGPTSKTTVIPAPVVPVVEPEPAPVVVEKKAEPVVIEDIRKDIFFEIRSSVLSEESVSKLNEIVVYMRDHKDAKVTVSAYADVNTGNPRINQGYSEARENSVVNYLVDHGVAPARISHAHYGDTVQPFAENDLNRVAICVATVK
ncbi:MAG: OmpA family protein [Bacteroidaceae bacterium]|nr:OmpA family protein [Bacteroidaceae bacterium]